MRSPRALVLDHDGELALDLERVMTKLGGTATHVVDATALGRYLDEGHPVDVLVAGLRRGGRVELDRLALVHEELPALPVLLVTPPDGISSILEGPRPPVEVANLLLRSGAVEMVVQPAPVDRLLAGVEACLARGDRLRDWAEGRDRGRPGRAGDLHAVTSARGGAGRSFFAANLATYLAGRGESVCLLDLDVELGDAAAALGLEPRFTLADLVGAGDAVLVESFAQHCEPHPAGFCVLAAPPPELGVTLSTADILDVVSVARRTYRHVVVDLPLATSNLSLAMAREATTTWCLAKPDLVGLRSLAASLAAAERLHLPGGIRVVLNMVADDSGLSIADVERALPGGLAGVLPYSDRVVRTVNGGRTMLQAEPASPLSQRLRALFGLEWPPPEGEEPVEASPSRFGLGRLWTRRAR